MSDRVDIYADATGQWTQTTQSQTRSGLTAVTAGGYVLFAGGFFGMGPGNGSDVVDVFEEATGTWSTETLPGVRWGLSSVAMGNTAFFAGGANTNGVLQKPSSRSTWGPASGTRPVS